MSATRWLVTGARGQLGSELVRALDGHQVTALGRGELDIAAGPVEKVLRAWAGSDWVGRDGVGSNRAGRDRVGRDGVGRGVSGAAPTLVVLNAAAWTDVDGAETDPAGASAANEHGPARLAAACAELGATLVHVSTDYVFAGTHDRPYEVDDPTDPKTVYGVSKLAGERAVRATLSAHYIVRTGWVYGATGGNFVKTIAALRHRRDTLNVVADQVGGPTWAAELAEGLVALAGSGAPYGTYHCTGGGQASWYELARAVFEEVGADPDRIRPCGTAEFPRPAPRPAYSVLSGQSWAATGVRPMSPWREALHSAFRVNRSSLDTPIR
jgi:dTDP-4-dehydrorhamnose reductase